MTARQFCYPRILTAVCFPPCQRIRKRFTARLAREHSTAQAAVIALEFSSHRLSLAVIAKGILQHLFAE